MHACATTCQPLWASAPSTNGLHPVYRPSWTHRPRAASVGDSLSEPFRGSKPICRSSIRTREVGSLALMGKHRLCRQVSSSTSTTTTLTRAGHAKRAIPEQQQQHVVAGPRPSLSHAAARACGWPGGDFAVITSTVFGRPGPTGPIRYDARVVEDQPRELGMTVACSETRFARVRVPLHSLAVPFLPFAREVNDQPLLSVAAQLLSCWLGRARLEVPRQLPWKDKHASCGPVGGPERPPRRLVGITHSRIISPLHMSMAFLAGKMHAAWLEPRAERPPQEQLVLPIG
jgi:hypothetical protein